MFEKRRQGPRLPRVLRENRFGKLSTKLNLRLGGFFICAWAIMLLVIFGHMRSELIANAEADCKQIITYIDAAQRYTREVLRPVMYDLVDEGRFVPEGMSTTFLSRRITERFQESYPDYYFKFATENPRNELNLADSAEQSIIREFIADPKKDEWQGILERGGESYLIVATPIWFNESCMTCHGSPGDAPADLVERYGATEGFGRSPGDVAIKSVGIPIGSPIVAARIESVKFAGLAAILLACLFVLTSILLRSMVIGPLSILRSGAEEIGSGELSHRLGIDSNDEMEDLANSFNTMAERLQESYSTLEQRVAERTEELRKFKAISDVANYGSAIADLNGIILYANETYARMHGYEVDEVIGKHLSIGHSEEQMVRVKVLLDQVMREGGFSAKEVPHVRRDGTEFPTLMNCALVTDDRGRVQYISAIANDISDLKQAEEELRQQKELAENATIELARTNRQLQKSIEQASELAEQAAAADYAKSEFLANMSHEIRTPLNGIIGMTDLVIDSELDDSQREYLSLVKKSANDLLELINSILDLSKIEAGKVELEETLFNLREIVDDLVGVFAHRAHEHGLEFTSRIMPDVPAGLIGDPTRLRQVLANLVTNAVKFTDEGEIMVEVEVKQRLDDRVLLRFSIADTGIGIPQDKIEAIFQSFAQADGSTTRKYGGTGLGLAIAKKLVHLMGGEIGVESAPRIGSVFAFTASFGLASEAEIERLAPPPGIIGIRVLIVDANASSRLVIREMLESWGCIADEADSGKEALNLMQNAADSARPYNLLLLDLHLPDMDGPDLLSAMKENGVHPDVPVIALRTTVSREDIRELSQADFTGHLVKPVTKSNLFDIITDTLDLTSDAKTEAVNLDSLEPSLEPVIAPALRILLAEDNPVNQKVGEAILKKLGHACDIVNDGREALKALVENDYDLVLMDVQMPIMDGFEATEAIRGNPRTAGTLVIAMTAHAMEGDRERCLEAGMDDYIAKPITTTVLAQTISRWVKTRRDKDMTTDSSGHESSPVDPDVLDVEESLRQVGGDREVFREVLQLFIKEATRNLNELREAFGQKDFEKVERAAHTLKGAAGNIMAGRVQKAAAEIEKLTAGYNSDKAREMLALLENEIATLTDAIAKID